MDVAVTAHRRLCDALVRARHALIEARRPAWPLAMMRIGYGAVLLLWTVTMALDLDDLLGTDAIVPPELAVSGRWRWLPLDTTASVAVALVALAVASLAILVGWRPSVWLAVAFVLLVAVHHRNPLIINSGDLLLRDLAALLALCPTGAALSVDRWRRHGRGALRTAPLVAPWGLRLIQLQVVVVYFFAFWSKSGPLWRDGTAVSTVLRIDDLTRFGRLDVLADDVVLIAVLTWSALAVELALATLLWVRRLRPALVVAGVALLVYVLRVLLAQAVDLDSQTRRLRSELDEVI